MQDKPLKHLLYVGYAAKADRRKRQHEACGKLANWLATLVQATCNVLWGRGQFKMHFMVICVLGEPGQASIAEMLLTRITGAYYNTGGGFCIDVAGKSIAASILSLNQSPVHHMHMWTQNMRWVLDHTPLLANSKVQVSRHTGLLKREAGTEAERNRLIEEKFVKDIRTIQENYVLAQIYKNDPSWQTDGARELVKKMEDAWKEAGALYPECL